MEDLTPFRSHTPVRYTAGRRADHSALSDGPRVEPRVRDVADGEPGALVVGLRRARVPAFRLLYGAHRIRPTRSVRTSRC